MMDGKYNGPVRLDVDGSNVFHLAGLTIQILDVQVAAAKTTSFDFPEPFQTMVIACVAMNTQVGFGVVQTVSCAATSLSSFNIFHQNGSSATCRFRVIAIGY